MSGRGRRFGRDGQHGYKNVGKPMKPCLRVGGHTLPQPLRRCSGSVRLLPDWGRLGGMDRCNRMTLLFSGRHFAHGKCGFAEWRRFEMELLLQLCLPFSSFLNTRPRTHTHTAHLRAPPRLPALHQEVQPVREAPQEHLRARLPVLPGYRSWR